MIAEALTKFKAATILFCGPQWSPCPPTPTRILIPSNSTGLGSKGSNQDCSHVEPVDRENHRCDLHVGKTGEEFRRNSSLLLNQDFALARSLAGAIFRRLRGFVR